MLSYMQFCERAPHRSAARDAAASREPSSKLQVLHKAYEQAARLGKFPERPGLHNSPRIQHEIISAFATVESWCAIRKVVRWRTRVQIGLDQQDFPGRGEGARRKG